MTREEIDALVAQVGDEILTRLGAAGPAAPPPEPAPVTGWESPGLPLARRLDLDLTRPGLTTDQVHRQARRAAELGLRAVWTPSAVAAAAERALRGAETVLGVVVGYPHGSAATPAKALEAELALTLGARELDAVASPAAARDLDMDALFADMTAVAAVARSAGASLTATLEPALIPAEGLPRAAAACRAAGAGALRLATGQVAHEPVEPEQVMRLKSALGAEAIVIAGGVASFGRLTRLLRAGAARIVSPAALELAKSRQ